RPAQTQAAVRVVDVEQAARDDRARSCRGLLPGKLETAAAQRPPARRAAGRDEEPRLPARPPDGGRREEAVAERERLELAALPAGPRRAVQAREAEQAQPGILAALDGEAARQDGGRRRAEVDVAGVEPRLVGRRPALEEPSRV